MTLVLRGDADLIRAHHRSLRPAFLQALGFVLPSADVACPGYHAALRSSLASLAEQGYGLEECAVMFGVSRERVRQWAEAHGLADLFRQLGIGTRNRVWSPDLGRFVPIRKRDLDARQMAERLAARDSARRARRRTRRRDLVQGLRLCAESLGRAPTIAEASEWVGISHATAARYFRGRRPCVGSPPYRSLFRRWYRLAGLHVRRMGELGHREAA